MLNKKKNGSPNLYDKVMGWTGSVSSLIIHTIFFAASFGLVFLGVPLDKILLVVTTAVSLEAIYLAIFIQMAVNKAAESLEEVEEDIEEIQEDVEGMEKDIDEIQEDIDEIEKDDVEDENRDIENKEVLGKIENQLQILMREIDKIKSGK